MGSNDIIRPLPTVLSSAANKSQQHWEKNYWERQESNQVGLGEKQVCYLCAMQPSLLSLFASMNQSRPWAIRRPRLQNLMSRAFFIFLPKNDCLGLTWSVSFCQDNFAPLFALVSENSVVVMKRRSNLSLVVQLCSSASLSTKEQLIINQ